MSKTSDFLNMININYFLIATIAMGLFYLILLFLEHQKYHNFIKGKEKKQKKLNKIESFWEELSFFIRILGYSKHEEKIKVGFLLLLIIPSMYFLIQGAGSYSVFYPLFIFLVMNFLFKFSSSILNNKINKTLPNIIDITYRTMTRNDNLRSILYEVSVNYDGFLKEALIDLVIELETRPEVECLTRFSSKFSSMYMRSYIILLISFISKSKKKDVMENLKLLGETISSENKMKKDILSEKMGTSVQNWFLTGGAIIAFIGNLRFNEGGAEFFFQTYQGMLCLIIGFICIFATILFNVKSMS